ncbi:MAG TPA: ABC transporter permease [Chitinophagaceae bacterium]|nr:ABC transporter permease [Chitinophagaceae bacterium]
MIRNYLKIALRNLKRNKGFSFINILGLAIGMASAMLILLWIQHERSYDKFHENKDRIYEAWNRSVFSGKLQCWNTTPKVLASAIQRDNPEVATTARVNWATDRLFKVGDKSLMGEGNIVDSTFLQVFSFRMIKGDPKTALMDPASIVLTASLSRSLFGDKDPIGQVITVDNKIPMTVTGVLEDVPVNSRFKFKFLMPWARLRLEDGDDTYWGNNSCATYVLLKENASLASIAPRVKEMRRKYDAEDKQGEFFLYPLERWRLYSRFENGVETGGFIEFIRLFAIIAVFILLIACINFMNLSTARSEKRAREVGIRKVIGAQKSALIGQFLGESVLISLISGIVALLIVQLSLPAFGELTGKEIHVDYNDPRLWISLIGFIMLTGLLAGSYPAFFLSSFKPVTVLKGGFKKVNALVTPRKVLVVLQFTFAIILMIATLVVRNQIEHAREREVGYNKNNLVYTFTGEDVTKNYMLIKNELLSSGTAISVTKTSAPMTEGWSNTWGIQWPGKDPNDKTIIDRFCADDKIAATAGLQILKGRDFDLASYPTDSSAVLLNESAVKLMGFKDPIGSVIQDNDQEWHVVGVFKDFILNSPYQPTIPMVIEGAKGWFNCVHVKLNPANTTAANIASMEKVYKKYSPHYPFDYKFIDREYEEKFKAEQRAGTLSGLFAGLTIFISCLGLFGLATYMAENRIKEIGVRKVLGASVADITTLLSKDFLKLVAVSLVIASPVAWWLMNAWLKDFNYRIDMPVSAFLVAGGLSLLIALLTVSSQAIKAAVANPVKSLRTE